MKSIKDENKGKKEEKKMEEKQGEIIQQKEGKENKNLEDLLLNQIKTDVSDIKQKLHIEQNI